MTLLQENQYKVSSSEDIEFQSGWSSDLSSLHHAHWISSQEWLKGTNKIL